jgi:hypothetical protein
MNGTRIGRTRAAHCRRQRQQPASIQQLLGQAEKAGARRWHVENPHFCGVFAGNRKKIAFFQRFSRLFACVLKKPWL